MLPHALAGAALSCPSATDLPAEPSLEDVAEEADWPPNPYQALADAQVRAGAWPGSHLLAPAPAPPTAAALLLPIGAAAVTAGAAAEQAAAFFPDVHLLTGPSCCLDDQRHPAEAFLGEGWLLMPWAYHCGVEGAEYELQAHCCSASLGATSADDEADAAEGGCDIPSDCSTAAEPALLEEDGLHPASSSSSSAGHLPWKLSHRAVPKGTDLSERFRKAEGAAGRGEEAADPNAITTLMIRNVPNAYTRHMLVEELEYLGFAGAYDFLYLPIDQSTGWNVGYAFVNFISPEHAERCREAMTSYVFCCFPHGSGKVTQISAAHIQGLQKNLEYYSKTAVHCAGSQTNRPLVLPGGQQGAPELTSRSRRRRRQRHARAAAEAGGAEAALGDD